MTGLLVSVRNVAEAQAAISGGANLVDVKEPRRGALGSAPAAALREIACAVAGRRPLSAALGELTESTLTAQDDAASATADALCGYQYAKVGLAGATNDARWREHWAEVVARLAPGVKPVAVIYADGAACGAPPPDDVIEHAVRLRCAGLLVDTYAKDGRNLLDHWSAKQVRHFIDAARQSGMLSALAGSLDVETARRLLTCKPDLIAVRSGVCEGGRMGVVRRELVAEFTAALRIGKCVEGTTN